ncbi:unnamed protein product, partial [Ascophyllum nodosum]
MRSDFSPNNIRRPAPSVLVRVLPRALSPRNPVSGYECGRVFPAGVGPGSPSREMQPTGYHRGSACRLRHGRRYGRLRMVFPGVRFFRAPIWCPSEGWRHARGREHGRGEPGSS